jgi:hypothetical protein
MHLPQATPGQQSGVRCWGFNVQGVLGTGFPAGMSTALPVKVPGLETDVVRVVVGLVATCGVTSGGALRSKAVIV